MLRHSGKVELVAKIFSPNLGGGTKLCKYLQNMSNPFAVLKSFVKGANQPIKGVMVPKKGELPQEHMNEAKKAHLVSQAGTWSWRSASSWQLAAFIRAGK